MNAGGLAVCLAGSATFQGHISTFRKWVPKDMS